ncbi:MAG: hypothetical protein R3E31_15955 [Chloroflexota bacterium]
MQDSGQEFAAKYNGAKKRIWGLIKFVFAGLNNFMMSATHHE